MIKCDEKFADVLSPSIANVNQRFLVFIQFSVNFRSLPRKTLMATALTTLYTALRSTSDVQFDKKSFVFQRNNDSSIFSSWKAKASVSLQFNKGMLSRKSFSIRRNAEGHSNNLRFSIIFASQHFNYSTSCQIIST